MSCETDIQKINCRLDALEKNQDVMWESLYSDTDPYTLYFAGDVGQGYPNTHLSKLADYLENELNRIGQEKFLGFFAAGDLNYPDGEAVTVTHSIAPFLSLIDAKKFFPVLGNHCIDSEEEAEYLSRFNYIPLNGPTEASHRRNYYLDFRDKINMVIFCFDPLYKTSTVASGVATLVPSPLSTPIAVQKSWLYDTVDNLRPASAVAVIHHPFATLEDSYLLNQSYMPSWDLEFAQNSFPYVVNGHAHSSFRLTKKRTSYPFNECEILNASTFGGARAVTTSVGAAITPEYEYLKRFYSSEYHVIKMEVFKTKVVTSFIAVDSTMLIDSVSSSQHSFVKPLKVSF